MDINRTIVTGRLTRDVSLEVATNGNSVLKFSVAVNERVKEGEAWVDRPSFFDMIWWTKSAESVKQYLVKGKQVCVEGRLKQERWEKDGVNRSKVVVMVDHVKLLGSDRKDETGAAPGQNTAAPPPTPTAPRTNVNQEFPEDIPF